MKTKLDTQDGQAAAQFRKSRVAAEIRKDVEKEQAVRKIAEQQKQEA